MPSLVTAAQSRKRLFHALQARCIFFRLDNVLKCRSEVDGSSVSLSALFFDIIRPYYMVLYNCRLPIKKGNHKDVLDAHRSSIKAYFIYIYRRRRTKTCVAQYTSGALFSIRFQSYRQAWWCATCGNRISFLRCLFLPVWIWLPNKANVTTSID